MAKAEKHAVLEGHKGAVRAVAFAPDGRTICDRRLRPDHARGLGTSRRTGRSPRLKGHKGTVRARRLLPRRPDSLATAGEDGAVKLWDFASMTERATLSGHGEMVGCLAFTPGGQTLASGGWDSTV